MPRWGGKGSGAWSDVADHGLSAGIERRHSCGTARDVAGAGWSSREHVPEHPLAWLSFRVVRELAYAS
jgi:hypothetical protein